jgi:hypothetical protein
MLALRLGPGAGALPEPPQPTSAIANANAARARRVPGVPLCTAFTLLLCARGCRLSAM